MTARRPPAAADHYNNPKACRLWVENHIKFTYIYWCCAFYILYAHKYGFNIIAILLLTLDFTYKVVILFWFISPWSMFIKCLHPCSKSTLSIVNFYLLRVGKNTFCKHVESGNLQSKESSVTIHQRPTANTIDNQRQSNTITLYYCIYLMPIE